MRALTRRIAAAAGPALLVLLAAADPALAQEGGGSPIFSVDLGLVIWTWVVFLLTLAVLAWKVFPMIAGSLEERREKIQSAIDAAREDREEARRLLEEHRRQLEEARQEAQEILDEGREAGERLREEILQEAREEREEMMERTRREMRREREQLREEIRQEAVDVALAAAERLMRSEMDREENRRLVRDYIEKVG
ncbi:MAG: F0F1 ATP synthase subunit B [Gemmatimonadota bacterium]